jgi:hypothetical protein
MNRTHRSQPGFRPVPLPATHLQTPLRLAVVLLAGVALAGCENMSARQTARCSGASPAAMPVAAR